MREGLAIQTVEPEMEPEQARARRRVLIVEDDPLTLQLLTELLRSDSSLFEPVGVTSAEEALQVLADQADLGCLLADIGLPGMDGLQLLHSARRLRPDLKVVIMTASPTDVMHREVVESGAVQLLAKPLDLEHLTASLADDRPGSLSYLEGDFDLLEVCTLFAACQAEGGMRVRQGERTGLVALRGAALVHVAADGLVGEPAFESLCGWGSWHFESLSALHVAHLPVNCARKLPEVPERREGARAAGSLCGLTLRHLIGWVMRRGHTGVLTVSSEQGSGVLCFEGGRIDRAETPEGEGGPAAEQILGWEHVRVRLSRSPATAAAPAAGGEAVEGLLDRFRDEVDGFVATSIVRRKDGSPVAGRTAGSGIAPAVAAGWYARVLDCHLEAVEQLGVGAAWGETEDLLITAAHVYLLIRRLGDGHYHWLAVSREANLALCRLLMRSYAPLFLRSLGKPLPA